MNNIDHVCLNGVHSAITYSGSLSPEDKSRFGVLATSPAGRSAFARSLNGHRAGRSCLTEGAFLSLAQSTAVMLFESCEAGDWSPAKVLMNMCFTFYTEGIVFNNPLVTHFITYYGAMPVMPACYISINVLWCEWY